MTRINSIVIIPFSSQCLSNLIAITMVIIVRAHNFFFFFFFSLPVELSSLLFSFRFVSLKFFLRIRGTDNSRLTNEYTALYPPAIATVEDARRFRVYVEFVRNGIVFHANFVLFG